MLVEELRDLGERVEVVDDLLADAGPLDLDRDRAAVAQRRAVHLAERCGRERSGVELGEGLRDPDAQFLGDDSFDLREGERLDVVLQARERVDVGDGEQVRARREELAELDERGPELLEVARELLGLRRIGFGAPTDGRARRRCPIPFARSARPYLTRRTAMSL